MASVGPAIQQAIEPILGAGRRVEARAFEEQFRTMTAERRFNAGILGIFGALALLIGAAGVYGVVATAVAQQTREIGVRLALGATPGRIRRAVIASAARQISTGAAIGLMAAWASARIFESVLFGVTPRDPLVYASVIGVLVVIGLGAAWIPARRASKVDPLIALRAE